MQPPLSLGAEWWLCTSDMAASRPGNLLTCHRRRIKAGNAQMLGDRRGDSCAPSRALSKRRERVHGLAVFECRRTLITKSSDCFAIVVGCLNNSDV